MFQYKPRPRHTIVCMLQYQRVLFLNCLHNQPPQQNNRTIVMQFTCFILSRHMGQSSEFWGGWSLSWRRTTAATRLDSSSSSSCSSLSDRSLISCALAFVSGDVRPVSSTILRSVGRLAIDVSGKQSSPQLLLHLVGHGIDLHDVLEGRGSFVPSLRRNWYLKRREEKIYSKQQIICLLWWCAAARLCLWRMEPLMWRILLPVGLSR